MTSDVELLMLIGDKTVKLYEKDKEIKELKSILIEVQEEIERLKIEKNEFERKYTSLQDEISLLTSK